jgi:hypothetical protein
LEFLSNAQLSYAQLHVAFPLQAVAELKAKGMKGLPDKTLVTILDPNCSATAIFSFSERANVLTHNHIPLTVWDKITMITRLRNLWQVCFLFFFLFFLPLAYTRDGY